MGTNFALFSEVAERVELCLFDDHGQERRLDMIEVDGYVWHCFLPGTGPGQRYGYRVHGPHDPDAGDYRLACGGSYADERFDCNQRSGLRPDFRTSSLRFRVCREP